MPQLIGYDLRQIVGCFPSCMSASAGKQSKHSASVAAIPSITTRTRAGLDDSVDLTEPVVGLDRDNVIT